MATSTKRKPKPQPTKKGKTKMANQPAKKPAAAAPAAAKDKAPAAEQDRNLPAAHAAPTALVEPPEWLREKMKQDKGKGVSTDTADNLVPLIYVLQALSPQVNRRNPAFIEGAEPGAFWLRNAPVEIIPGDPEQGGMIAQSCYYFHDWIEWKPRDSGGGFIARHAPLTGDRKEECPVGDAVRTEDPQNNRRVRFLRPNGNEVIHTRNHVINVYTREGVLPYIIPFSSTGHTTSRAWMQLMNTMAGGVGFAAKYKLTTRERSNPSGTWFAVDVKFHEWCDEAEYAAGLRLNEAFASGEKQAEAPVASGGGEGTEGGDDIPF
jgi:hypothetical protein